jgi:uncharacterized protein YfaS (alpha-2-macroglobulin family)
VTAGGLVFWSGADNDGYYGLKTMASDTRTTALTLSALVRIRPGHELEPGIVRWLMSQRREAGWGTTNETAFAIIGLTDHLLVTSFAENGATTGYNVTLDGQVVASGSLGRGEPAVAIEIPVETLTAGANELRISQSGGGRLYYVVSSRVYLPQRHIAAAGAVTINRAYLDAETGLPIEQFYPGQLVKVRLQVTMPARAAYVIIEDSLPGALEALNEGLNTTTHQATANDWRGPVYYWQELGYNHKEVRGDRVSFFITEMESGRRTIAYLARVTHSGTFTAMPAEAHAMYDLATWGRSSSAVLVVAE